MNRSLARKVRRWMSVRNVLILALVFAAKSDGHIDAKERAAIDQQLREAGVEREGACTH
ncbi:inner membrane protein [Escherichia coli]|uniref:Inner membrane protein n=1 Tax=Escherichia coli TaxID=562 RepID=A0A377K576_ECOLX|nr:inner membrane protein [Escherichia coli]